MSDMNEVKSIHQVGPRYGVRDFMRRIDRSWNSGMEEAPWVPPAEASLKVKVSPEVGAYFIYENIMSKPAGEAVMSHEIMMGRRLGKPFAELIGQIGQTSYLSAKTHDEVGRTEESVLLHDYCFHVEKDRVLGTMSPSRIAITRHALERLYERERIETGHLSGKIRETIADVRRSIAFSVMTGLSIGELPDAHKADKEEGSATAALQIVPCSRGLLLIDVVLCCALRDHYPVIRLETRRSGTFAKGSPSRDPHVREFQRGGHIFEYAPYHLGRTYISEEMLRPEQIEYARLFREATMGVDLHKIANMVFGTQDVHKRANLKDANIILPNVDRLKSLIGQCGSLTNKVEGGWALTPWQIPEGVFSVISRLRSGMIPDPESDEHGMAR